MAKVALILSGCGYLDGGEIHETTLAMLCLAMAGHIAECFAPDQPQAAVINHLTETKEPNDTRNVLQESARIARGHISPLTELDPENFDALFIPGGFGVVANLSDFAVKEIECTVNPELEHLVRAFHSAKKPILATCIAPALLGKIFSGSTKVKMTLGSDPKNKALLDKMGMEGVLTGVDEACFDEENRVYTTPCYMEPEDIAGLFEGIKQIVSKI